MIDISKESLFSLTEAAAQVPRRRAGRKCHVATVYRWAQRGVRGIRLETIQVGGTRCTSRQAMQRFFEALTVQSAAPPAPSIPSLPDARKLADVDRQLDEIGL